MDPKHPVLPEDPLDNEHPCADPNHPLSVYVCDGQEYPDVATVLPGPCRDALVRLFAAAPDLLRACQTLVALVRTDPERYVNHDSPMAAVMAQTMEAVAKAKGGPL